MLVWVASEGKRSSALWCSSWLWSSIVWSVTTVHSHCFFPSCLVLGVSLTLSSSCKPSYTDTLFLPLFQSKSIVLAVLLTLCPFCWVPPPPEDRVGIAYLSCCRQIYSVPLHEQCVWMPALHIMIPIFPECHLVVLMQTLPTFDPLLNTLRMGGPQWWSISMHRGEDFPATVAPL